MGVRGLTSYIKRNAHLTRKIKLRDTDLVIDGSCLGNFLYGYAAGRTGCSNYAGDSVSFGRLVKRFFQMLKHCNVRAVVVMDGGVDPEDGKLDRLMSNCKSRMSRIRKAMSGKFDCGRQVISSLLDPKVFRDILVEENIVHVHSLFEADGAVASLAKRLKCPVMGEDSDYCLFDLEHGYISLQLMNYHDNAKDVHSDPLNWRSRSEESPYLDCQIFLVSHFLQCSKLTMDVLPLLSLQLGNDFKEGFRSSVETTIASLQGLTAEQAIANYLDGQRSEQREYLAKTTEFYRNRSDHLFCLISHVLIQREAGRADAPSKCPCNHRMVVRGAELSDKFIQRFIDEVQDPTLLNIQTVQRKISKTQAEDITQVSSFECSFELQRYVIALLRKSESHQLSLELIDRRAGTCEVAQVTLSPLVCLPNGSAVPTYDKLDTLSMKDRRRMLLAMLGLNQTNFTELHNHLIKSRSIHNVGVEQISVLCSVLRYAYVRANMSIPFVLSVLVTLMFYFATDNDAKYDLEKLSKHKSKGDGNFQAHLVHPFAQLQATLVVFRQLNSLLEFPLPEFKPHLCMNGIFVYNVQSILANAKDPVKVASHFFENKSHRTLYKSLVSYATN